MLATKYRPKRFRDVVGQTAPRLVLRKMVSREMMPASLVFSGMRGTGKTSMARILARAVNCSESGGGDSCGDCSSCSDVDAGSAPFLWEVDAASSGGVEEMRTLVSDARYSSGFWKVIVLDEVHAASSAGFQVLLKTLEEPPPRVTFVLVTTEPEKIPATIMTRSMQCRFTRIPPDEVFRRLADVADSEGIEVTERALDWIVSYADGGMRDALMVLDQVSLVKGGRVTTEALVSVLGERSCVSWLEILATGNVAASVLEIDALASEIGAGAVVERAILDLRDLLVNRRTIKGWTKAVAAEVIPKLWKMATQIRNLGPDDRAAAAALSAELGRWFAKRRGPGTGRQATVADFDGV